MRQLTEIGDEDSSFKTFRMLSKRVRSTAEHFSMSRLQAATITEMLIAMSFKPTNTIPIVSWAIPVVTSNGQFGNREMFPRVCLPLTHF
jgi:hypothetical protein